MPRQLKQHLLKRRAQRGISVLYDPFIATTTGFISGLFLYILTLLADSIFTLSPNIKLWGSSILTVAITIITYFAVILKSKKKYPARNNQFIRRSFTALVSGAAASCLWFVIKLWIFSYHFEIVVLLADNFIFTALSWLVLLRRELQLYSQMQRDAYQYVSLVTSTLFHEQIKNTDEEEFGNQCRNSINTALAYCVNYFSVVKAKYQFIERDYSDIWAAVYFLIDGELHLESCNRYNPTMPRVLDNSVGFASWAISGFSEELQEQRHRPWKTDDIIFSESLNIDELFTAKNISNDDTAKGRLRNKVLPNGTAMGIRLVFQNKVIGVFILISKENDIIDENDVLPISFIVNSIMMFYAHNVQLCPWHRNGWRDYKEIPSCIRQCEFTFDVEKYSTNHYESTRHKYESDSTISSVIDEYRMKFSTITKHRNRIKNVYLLGTFNGWMDKHIQMDKGPGNTWKKKLYLPNGYYYYLFKVEYIDGDADNLSEVAVFDPYEDITVHEFNGMKVLDSLHHAE